jgi:hypothetical protein
MEIIGHQRARGIMDMALGRSRAKTLYTLLSNPDVFTPYIALPTFGQRLLLAGDVKQPAKYCALVGEAEYDTLRKYIDAVERAGGKQAPQQAGRAHKVINALEAARMLPPTQAALIREEVRLAADAAGDERAAHCNKAREWLDGPGRAQGTAIETRKR